MLMDHQNKKRNLGVIAVERNCGSVKLPGNGHDIVPENIVTMNHMVDHMFLSEVRSCA